MPRPTTKADLLDQADAGYARVRALVAGIDPALRDAEFPFADRDRCLRDVVGHLRVWQDMMLGWHETGMAGDVPAIPAPGHTWRTIPQLNVEIWSSLQGSSLEEEEARLAATHARLWKIIDAHTDDELFTKRHYPWTGSTSLGAFLVSATSSHYGWAATKIRKAVRGWPSPHSQGSQGTIVAPGAGAGLSAN